VTREKWRFNLRGVIGNYNWEQLNGAVVFLSIKDKLKKQLKLK